MLDESSSGGATLTLRGSSILQALKNAGVEVVVTVPDLWTSDTVLRPLPSHPEFQHVKICKEDEGFGICAGLAATGKRAIIIMQCTGLFDSINALRVVGVEFGQPICMMVGLLFKEPDKAPTESAQYSVRIVEPILDAMGVRHHLLELENDAATIKEAIDWAYAESKPVALLIGRSPV